MGLLYKQLIKQMLQSKIFIILLLLLMMLTSFSFFFVIFSIDGNMAILNELLILSEQQKLYLIALQSNKFLGYNFLFSMEGLTVFVIVMYFYRFYRTNKKEIGCLKAIGFRDSNICACFVIGIGIMAIVGGILGMIAGYPASDVLLNANEVSYLVHGLVKDVSFASVGIAFGSSVIIYCFTAFCCYFFVRGKETGVLLAGISNQAKLSRILKAANWISIRLPVKNQFSLRIAFRKPLGILLIVVAVMSFSVCGIIGQSLYISSKTVLDSQLIGHQYKYEAIFHTYQIGSSDNSSSSTSIEANAENKIYYLKKDATVFLENHQLEQEIVGFYSSSDLYQLQNKDENILSPPDVGSIYINPNLMDTYSVEIGDTIVVDIQGKNCEFEVADIAVNAVLSNIYINVVELSKILAVSDETYNGILSIEKIDGDIVVTAAERMKNFQRNTVSNQISAVINQATGCLIGAILIFLALYLNIQDNTHDILVLSGIGYRMKEIRKLLVNIYMPIVWISYFITLFPSILLVQSIQRSLSISTKDYIPFETNIFIILIIFFVLNLLYWLVQFSFGIGIRRICRLNHV